MDNFEIDDSVVAELREAFLRGATPSGLMRNLTDRFADAECHSIIACYFQAAFLVFPSTLPIGVTRERLAGEHFAYLNYSLVHDMIRTYASWGGGCAVEPFWGSLPASDLRQLSSPDSFSVSDNLESDWDRLSERSQSHIRSQTAMSTVLYEKAKILSSLVERLQSRIESYE